MQFFTKSCTSLCEPLIVDTNCPLERRSVPLALFCSGLLLLRITFLLLLQITFAPDYFCSRLLMLQITFALDYLCSGLLLLCVFVESDARSIVHHSDINYTVLLQYLLYCRRHMQRPYSLWSVKLATLCST